MGQHQRTVGERVGEAGQCGDFSTLYAREAQTEQIMTKPAEKPISAPFGRHRPDSMGQQKRTAPEGRAKLDQVRERRAV